MSLIQLKKDLRSFATTERAKSNAWFFKTGVGQYGEGDVFIGVTVPNTRKVVHKHKTLSLKDIETLIKSKIHEERLCGVLLLVHRYEYGTQVEKKEIYDFYISNAQRINNWDLVDSSAGPIVGDYLINHNRKILEKLARSKNLWEKRIAIVATFAFIKNGEYEWTFRICTLLMSDTHDLIHKACGWMLREVGKRVSEEKLCEYIEIYGRDMPRTMLRYAIERLSPSQRKHYLNM